MVEPNGEEPSGRVEDTLAGRPQKMPWRAVLLACLAGSVLAVLIAAGLVWWGGR